MVVPSYLNYFSQGIDSSPLKSNFCYHCFILGEPVIPLVDMGFAISATAINSREHFRKMQEVIKTFVDKYGSQRIAYSVLTFGSNPTISVRFSDAANGDEVLMSIINNIPQNEARASLDKALHGAKELFKDSNGARKDAMKVLVVITDEKSDSLEQEVKKAAQRLDENDIRVIGIALGDGSDGELEGITDIEGDVINTTDSTSPEKIVEKVVEQVLNSKFLSNVFYFVCRTGDHINNIRRSFFYANSTLTRKCPDSQLMKIFLSSFVLFVFQIGT